MSSVYDTDTLIAAEICELAGEDPGEVLTKWVVEDIAAALIEGCAHQYESEEDFKTWAVNVIKTCDKTAIADILIGGSHWDETIPDFVTWNHCDVCGEPKNPFNPRDTSCTCPQETN